MLCGIAKIFEESETETTKSCKVKKLSVHGGCLGNQRR
jgi:hypothetical protein